MMLANARLKGQLERERRRADDHRDHGQQALQTVARLAPASGPPSITIENRPSIHVDNHNASNATHTTTAMTHNEIKAGDGSCINTGSFQPSGSMVNLGALSDWARRSINGLQRLTAGIMATTKLVAESSHLATAMKTLLPLIAGFFV